VRRKRAGRKIAEPDAGHIHHRLLARGMTPLETALTFYLATGILGCIALTIYGHRKIIDAALGLLVISLIGIIWRSRRRPQPALQLEENDEYVIVPGHRAVPTRMRHGGEAD